MSSPSGKTNKFQKSVLERLEQEQNRQKESPKGTGNSCKKPAAGRIPVPAEQTVPATAAPSLAPPAPVGYRAFLAQPTQRRAKNKTFYLDEELIETIQAAAREQKTTDSRLVNDILRGVFSL